jgi:cell division protein ZipA
MDELRWAFLVLGGLAIIGVLIHGIWITRRSNHQAAEIQSNTSGLNDHHQNNQENRRIIIDDPLMDEQHQRTHAAYDALGVEPVHVGSAGNESAENLDEQEIADFEPYTNLDELDIAHLDDVQVSDKEPSPTEKPKIYDSVVTQPKPEYVAQQREKVHNKQHTEETDQGLFPDPPAFLLKDNGQKTKPSFLESGIASVQSGKAAKPTPKPVKTEDPMPAFSADPDMRKSKSSQKIKERELDQFHIDFDRTSPAIEIEKSAMQDQEVLILNVKTSTTNPISGADLLPMLLTLGFKYGDQNIFHRHVNSDGKGPILFSLANMFKPGHFDIDNMQNFTTRGVSLFMILPIEGDPHQVFNMMHNAARKIAEEFSAQVLDGRRGALTHQSRQQYIEKIREFERQRRIHG